MIHGLDTAIYLANESALAYDSGADGTHIASGLCHCVIRRTASGEIVVAFRGTEDIEDWISNGDVGKSCFGNHFVHAGFAASLAPILWDIRRAIANVRKSADDQLWVCGHSRGGAFALLTGASLAMTNQPATGVYTFGSPRVGNHKFAAWCDVNVPGHHRYVNESDIVTRIPHFGYEHCGKLHWFDGVDWRTQMPIATRIGVWLFGRRWPFIGDTANDHGIGRYIAALTP